MHGIRSVFIKTSMATLIQHIKRTKWEHVYLYVCLTIITIGSVTLGYWALWPVKVIEFNPVVTTDKTLYHPGERITYTISYCKFTDLSGTVDRAIINGTRTTFTQITGNMTTGCHTVSVSDLVIPDYLDDDVYHIEASIEYQINPLRTQIAKWKTQEFKVQR